MKSVYVLHALRTVKTYLKHADGGHLSWEQCLGEILGEVDEEREGERCGVEGDEVGFSVELAAHLQQSELLYSSFASTILPHILLTCDIMGVEVALSGRVENQVVDGVADLRWQTEET